MIDDEERYERVRNYAWYKEMEELKKTVKLFSGVRLGSDIPPAPIS